MKNKSVDLSHYYGITTQKASRILKNDTSKGRFPDSSSSTALTFPRKKHISVVNKCSLLNTVAGAAQGFHLIPF